jgi:hypothetical protein
MTTGSESWFIQVEVLGGALESQLPVWYKGPVIRIGQEPGPDGIILKNFRGIAAHHATITAYDGNTVQITSIGSHVVRVAGHINEDWEHVQAINGNVYLNDRDVIHLGSLNRGCRLRFITCKPLEWRESRLIAVNENQGDDLVYNDFKPIQVDTLKGMPKWFIPFALFSALILASGIIAQFISLKNDPISAFGPKFDGYDHYQVINIEKPLERVALEGYREPFRAFVMAPNAEQANITNLADNFDYWDAKFYQATINTLQIISNSRGFWEDLERAKTNYATVVNTLRQLDLPTVFAAIPYQETRYNPRLTSYVCAGGIWQFMPETAKRQKLLVEGCKLKGVSKLWKPTGLAPPRSVLKESPYILKTSEKSYACKIVKCETDERYDVELSTNAAGHLLEDTWLDSEIAASGSAVQMTILAHNAGYDDSLYLGVEKGSNVLPAYRRYLKRSKKEDGINFYGDSIKCDSSKVDPHNPATTNQFCGSVLANQTQHYGYKVVAQHLLAVCYYAKNYGNDPAFREWKPYVADGGYCNLILQRSQ